VTHREGGDGNDTLDGGSGADTLRGGANDDVLGGARAGSSLDSGMTTSGAFLASASGNIYEGGTGNDTLRGTTKSDTYKFKLGDGADTISEVEATTGQLTGQVDELQFGAGITPGDITVTRSGTSLVLVHKNGTDKVTITNWYSTPGAATNQVERVTFEEDTDTVWTNTQLTSEALTVYGTAGNDTMTGLSAFNNTLFGLGGNDTLTGGALVDTLDGGDGTDILDGGKGRDILLGGAGDDTLGGTLGGASFDSGLSGSTFVAGTLGNYYEGGTGNDTLRGTLMEDLYVFNLGDGKDVINEVENAAAPSGQIDLLQFGPDILPDDIVVGRSGTSLLLKHKNGTDQVTISNWYTTQGATAKQVEQVKFANQVVWLAPELTQLGLNVVGDGLGNTLVGVNNYDNILDGAGGNDNLTGGNLDDTLFGGDGSDSLQGLAGRDFYNGGLGDDWLGYTQDSYGHQVSTVDYLGAGNVYFGGAGNDSCMGTVNADEYYFNLGDGNDQINETDVWPEVPNIVDTLKFGVGINPSDIKVSKTPVYSNLLLKINGTDSVTINSIFGSAGTTRRIERVEFADGTVWTDLDLFRMAGTITGTSGNDTLTGLQAWANVIHGAAGNDTITGGTQNDVLFGDSGNDSLNGGAGNDTYTYLLGDGLDTITETSGTDTVDLSTIDGSDIHFWKKSLDLYIQVGNGTDGILVKNQFATGGPPADFVIAGATSFTAAQVSSVAQIWPA
jgi:Ca2+-binding RTX toxin-like protein